MATLKALRDRRKSVQSTQKITLAMKMVAGAKLRRAQENVEKGRPYARLMGQMLQDLAQNSQRLDSSHPLLSGRGRGIFTLFLLRHRIEDCVDPLILPSFARLEK